MNQRLLNRPPLPELALLPRCLLALLPPKGNAQLHCLLTNGAFATALDEPRHTLLGTTGETTLANNFVDCPGPLAVNLANRGGLVTTVRNTMPRGVTIRWMAPYQVST